MTSDKSIGYRNTTQRAVILAEVEAYDGHLTAGEIFERVRRRYPTIAYGTVYRTLHLLAAHGLIQELTFADQASRFDKRVERHDHVHCNGCGAIVDVDVPVALMAAHVAEEQSGFVITSHHTVFNGLCRECQAAATNQGQRAGGRASPAAWLAGADRQTPLTAPPAKRPRPRETSEPVREG